MTSVIPTEVPALRAKRAHYTDGHDEETADSGGSARGTRTGLYYSGSRAGSASTRSCTRRARRTSRTTELRELPRSGRPVRRLDESEPPLSQGLQRLPHAARPHREIRHEGQERLLRIPSRSPRAASRTPSRSPATASSPRRPAGSATRPRLADRSLAPRGAGALLPALWIATFRSCSLILGVSRDPRTPPTGDLT